MSTTSVNLMKERVLRAALACVDELEGSEAILHTKATRELVRAVKAYRNETWRIDEAPLLIKELTHWISVLPKLTNEEGAKQVKEVMLRAKAFLGEREVNDDTTPAVLRPKKPRRRIKHLR